MLRSFLVAPLTLLPLTATADAPNVVADIAPVHSLTAMVMEGVGAPDLLLSPKASPHDVTLRPSDAAKLDKANVVIWVGESLTPFLERTLDSLAADARVLELLATPGWEQRQFGEGDDDHHGDAHDDHHADEHMHEGEHAHDGEHEHAKEGDHEDEHKHDHDGAHEEGHGHHHHEGLDPHAWLDPVVAQVWLEHIAETLSEADPTHAEQYAANAAAAARELTILRTGIDARMAGISGDFLLPHDAYRYFTGRFGLEDGHAIANHSAEAPSAARIAEIQELMDDHDIHCVLTDPQANVAWSNLAAEGHEVTVRGIDPIGQDLTPGATLYPQLIQQLADRMADCLGG